jgi:metal-responsive CopG/Arc/MetJ family transcriptional regulator
MTTVWLPEDLVSILDRVKNDRKDPTRSDTVRFLILRGLAELSILPLESKKALGIKEVISNK